MENEQANYVLLIKRELPEELIEKIKHKIKEYRKDILVITGDDIEFHKLDINNGKAER